MVKAWACCLSMRSGLIWKCSLRRGSFVILMKTKSAETSVLRSSMAGMPFSLRASTNSAKNASSASLWSLIFYLCSSIIFSRFGLSGSASGSSSASSSACCCSRSHFSISSWTIASFSSYGISSLSRLTSSNSSSLAMRSSAL